MIRPLPLLACGLSAGIALGPLPVHPLLPAGLAGLAILPVAGSGPVSRTVRWTLAAVLVGLLRAPTGGPVPPPGHPLHDLPPEGRMTTVLEGTVVAPRLPNRYGSSGYDLDLGEAGRVHVWRTGAPPLPGARVRVGGTLKPPRRATNPGGFDTAVYWGRRGSWGNLNSGRNDPQEIRRPASHLSLRAGIERVRRRVAGRIRGEISGPAGPVLEAMLLGERGRLEPERLETFERSGTIHFLAVSGLHVGILLGGVHLLLRGCGLPLRRQAPWLIGLALAYAGIAGFRPPVVRAAVLASLYLGGVLLRRPRDFAGSLAAAALLILAADPAQLFDAGFQLSFLVCAAIAGAVPPLDRAVREGAGDRPHGPVGTWLLRSLLVSAVAWAASAPLIAMRFGILTPLGIPGSLLMLPVVTGLLAAGSLYLAVAVAGLPAPALLTLPIEWGIAALDALATGLAAPWGHRYLHGPHAGWVVAYLLVGGLLVLAARRGWTASARVRRAAAASIVAVLLAAIPACRAPTRPGPEAVLLDVGHGLCLVLRGTDGTAVLYDCGAIPSDRVGVRDIAPALRALGVRRIRAVILSHVDADHTDEIETVLDRFPVDRIVTTGSALRSAEGAERIRAPARSRGIPVDVAAPGELLPAPPGVRLTVLYPPPDLADDLDTNDTSMAVLAEMEGGETWRTAGYRTGRALRIRTNGPLRILLTGDLDDAGVAHLLASVPPDRLAADLLLVPHHGSAVRDTDRLLAVAGPRAAWVSTRSDFPAAGTQAAYREAGVPWFETGRCGALLVAPADENR